MFIDTPEAIDRPSNNAILHLVSSEPSTNRTRNAHAALSQHGYQLFPGLTRLFDVRFYLRTVKIFLLDVVLPYPMLEFHYRFFT